MMLSRMTTWMRTTCREMETGTKMMKMKMRRRSRRLWGLGEGRHRGV